MRSILVGIATFVAFGSVDGKAQVFLLPTPAPQVTAANADWQLRGDPLFFAGDLYYPTGPSVFFEGSVMVRSGTHEGIPLYLDSTIEPYSVVYVPIGRNMMRPYERRRAGELAGTIGSRPASFPIERDAERSVAVFTGGGAPATAGAIERNVVLEEPRLVGTGSDASITARGVVTIGETRSGTPRTPSRQLIPMPRATAGIWLEFNGARWYSSGSAVPHVADNFVQIGTYRGFPVYRDATRRSSDIYVPSVGDGPLAPYSRR